MSSWGGGSTGEGSQAKRTHIDEGSHIIHETKEYGLCVSTGADLSVNVTALKACCYLLDTKMVRTI